MIDRSSSLVGHDASLPFVVTLNASLRCMPPRRQAHLPWARKDRSVSDALPIDWLRPITHPCCPNAIVTVALAATVSSGSLMLTS